MTQSDFSGCSVSETALLIRVVELASDPGILAALKDLKFRAYSKSSPDAYAVAERATELVNAVEAWKAGGL